MVTEKDREAQKERRKKYGINIREDGHITKPSEWSDVPDDEWLDPVNYAYPVPDAEHVRAAAVYWGRGRNREKYSEEDQKIIEKRLQRFKKKYGIGEEAQSNTITIINEISGAPAEIQILPYGEIATPKGDFVVDEESLKSIINDFEGKKNDIVIDYEHQTLADPPVAAPAAGWIKKLINKGRDGLWAVVEWTEKARQMIAAREYKYISPVFLKRVSDNKVLKLINAALTNLPNIDGMVPLVNKATKIEKEEGHMKELLKTLGLPEDAKEEEAILAVNKLKESSAQKPAVSKAVLDALGLKENAAESEVIGTIMAMKQSHSTVEQLTSELTAIKNKLAEKEANDAVEKAMQEGKITPAQKDWAKEYAKSDLAGFHVFVSKAPVIVPVGQKVSTDKKEGDGQLDEAQMFINKLCGVDTETFKKYSVKEV